jgi:transcriptional regulator with XRE-family HTH domain
VAARRENPASTLGEIIRRQRELSELSMRQFAALAGISNPYLSQIERGLREPSDKVMESIAEALQTSADALYHQAGLDDEPEQGSGVVEAITADPRLTAAQRRALLTTYEGFLAANGEPPRRRRRRPPTERA